MSAWKLWQAAVCAGNLDMRQFLMFCIPKSLENTHDAVKIVALGV
jgi:hypothetical protein